MPKTGSFREVGQDPDARRMRLPVGSIIAVSMAVGLGLISWSFASGHLQLMPFFTGVALLLVPAILIVIWGQVVEPFADLYDSCLREFDRQFDPAEDDGYIYRRNQKGVPIHVTMEERARFRDQFGRRVRLLLIGVILAPAALLAHSLWGFHVPDVSEALGIIAIAFGAIVLLYWIGVSPARQLARRKPLGPPRSKAEMRGIKARQASYVQLAAAAGAGILFAAMAALDSEGLSGWNWLWLLFGAGVFVTSAARVFNKWRFERDHPHDLASLMPDAPPSRPGSSRGLPSRPRTRSLNP